MALSQTEEWKCDLCGETHTGWGNNPEPIKSGRCCDRCNSEYVIPVRICGVTDEQLEKIRGGLDALKDGKKEHCIHCGEEHSWTPTSEGVCERCEPVVRQEAKVEEIAHGDHERELP